jgi:hypothetical protein
VGYEVAAQQDYVEHAQDGSSGRPYHLIEGSALQHLERQDDYRQSDERQKEQVWAGRRSVKIKERKERRGSQESYPCVRLQGALARQQPELVEASDHSSRRQRHEQQREPINQD